jgi:hypothetical protein
MALKVEMKVAGMKVAYDVHDELNFDTDRAFDELGKQAGRQTWWWSLVAMKEQEVSDYKTSMESDIAQVELALRADPAKLESSYGKVTEGVIKSALAIHPAIISVQTKLHEMQRDLALLKAMGKGFDSRGVMLATAGSAAKAEAQARLRELVHSVETPEG